jgi:DNA-binding NarL/FixJ family response regulator
MALYPTRMIPKTSPRIRVLLVDDHLVVRIGLRSLLETQRDLEVVAEASGGTAAVDIYTKHRPDVVLMDLRMPDLDGAQATARILARDPAARVLVLTTFDTDEDVYRALEAGAAGFFLKSTAGEPLLDAIRAVYAGTYRLPEEVSRRVEYRRSMPDLSGRELEVLALIVRGRSNKEIGAELGVAENTVKNHVKVILEKMGVADRTGAATTAIQRGIVKI